MQSVSTHPAVPRWYFIPVRVLLITFLLTLLTFAVSLFIGIAGTVIFSWLRGGSANVTLAYRHVALPSAAIGAGIALVAMAIIEIRRYRQNRALSQIAHASR
jgi:hypothetical protein